MHFIFVECKLVYNGFSTCLLSFSITVMSYVDQCLHLFIACDKNFHKRCSYKMPNVCNRLPTEAHAIAVHAVNVNAAPPPVHRHMKEVWSGRPLWINKEALTKVEVPHTFFVHTFHRPTVCHFCSKLVSFRLLRFG